MVSALTASALALAVAADDRTGALEVAGMCADAGTGPVVVSSGGILRRPDEFADEGGALVRVHDIATRHLDAVVAATRASDLEAAPTARRTAHKIDSTLRGNWASELLARRSAGGRRVLLVPGFPALGRTCVDGIVCVHGVPVGETEAAADARAGVRSSRPDEILVAAGAAADDVVRLADAGEVATWLAVARHAGAARFAVCDVRDDDDLQAIGAAWAGGADDVMLAGTAAAIAAGAGALVGRLPSRVLMAAWEITDPVLVVCGSLHPMARRQVAALVDRAAADGRTIEVVASDEPSSRPVPFAAAEAEARRLGAIARERIAAIGARTVVVIGGDTAAALLGDHAVVVGGTVATGMPWCTSPDHRGRHDADRDSLVAPIVITKAGGFGTPDTLIEVLLGGTRR